MQYPKDDIQKEIMKAAEKVFLENGFPKASMREIAQEAQVGLSNIYNYFKSKDDIFCTVVRPVISAFERMLHEHHGRYGADIMEMYSTEYLRYVIEEYITLIQKHRKLLVLLFFHAQGSSLENFKENITCERVLQRYEKKTSANEYQCNRLFYPPAHGMDVHHV